VEETDEDIDQLQRLLDESAARSGTHLSSAFSQDKRPSARQLVSAIPGIFEMHLGVVTSDGAPLVAPIDGIFYRGRVWLGIPSEAVRARLIRRDPRVSASYNAPDVAFIVHGLFVEPGADDHQRQGFDVLARSLYIAQYGDWFGAWLDERDKTSGPGVTGYIEPRRLYAKV
jgi:hypothetical protein